MKDIRGRLEYLDASPLKKLGQHFLKDDNVARRQVEAAGIESDDVVLEIGPGLGVLTEKIVCRAGHTIAIEKDAAMVEYLKDNLADKGDIDIIHGDFLDMDIPDFDKVISNVPFNISSPLTFKLLKEDFELGVLMYQKEYAKRMISSVGDSDYSRLSVMVSVRAEVDLLFDVSRNCFYPPPRVDASVVMLKPTEPSFHIIDHEKYDIVVRELFNYRRKKIKNALEYGLGVKGSGIPFSSSRVEELTPEDISILVEYLIKNDLL